MMETIPSGTILHGRYRIERVLGSGGFGHVYLSVDLQSNQQYAIKEYLVSGSSGQAQLQHEASVLSHLHHPNLPAFREAFSERGHYYVVLSYIEGSDLTDIIRIARQRNDVIPLTRIMNWILSVSDAVMFLHNQQPPVIHRDIKPDNIRITSDGTAILVDLGNAKATADGARTLFFIRHQGTPGYAPQEQYPGGSGTTVRSDVYALGGTLYFALTAHEPPSVSTRNTSTQQNIPDLPSLQDQLLNNPPEESQEANAQRQFRLGVSKPSKPAPRHIRHLAQLGTLPPPLLNQLNTIIVRAMAMHQKDRYHSVADFSNDLRKVMNAIQALPMAQPTVPPRHVDPNSTQPDLPQLYEALQSAKLAQTVQSKPDPVQSLTCPRCGKLLVTKAAFCPDCGFSLSGGGSGNKAQVNTTQAPDNRAPSPHDQGAASSQQSSQIGDQLPKKPESPPAHQAISPTPVTPATSVPKPTSRPAVAPISTLPPVQQKKAATPLQAQHIPPTTESSLQISPQSSNGTHIQPSRTARINHQMALILIMSLVLIILIAIIIFLLVRQGTSAQTTIQLPLALIMQGLPHEQLFSSTNSATTSLFTIGLWACSASIYSFVGGA
jgi:serine/threonine protein kinase